MEQRTTLVLEDTEKHGQSVKRFRSLCDMHRIPFGGATNLTNLVHSVKDDRRFAMDFWAMVGDLSAQERGSLSDSEIIGVITEGSTGLAVTALPETEKVALGELRNLLAGMDVESPVLPDPIAAPENTLTPEASFASHEEPSASQSNGDSTSRRKGDTTEMSTARESISDALLRLERMSRELRDQLVVIEQVKRSDNLSEIQDAEKIVDETSIEKIEEPAVIKIQEAPVPTVLTNEKDESTADETESQMTSMTFVEEPAPHTAQVDQRIASHVPPSPSVKEQEVFAPRSVGSLSRRGLAPPADVDDDPSIVVPLAAYAEDNPRTIAFRALAVALLLAVIGTVWFMVNRGDAQSLMSRSSIFAREKLALFRQEIHNLTSDTPTPAPAKQPEAATTQQASPTPQHQTEVAPQPAPPEAAPSQTNPKIALPPAVNTHPNASQPVVREQSAPLDTRNAVRVSSSVMEENLLVSRVPIYPDGARAMRLEGTVTVETVISESGAVRYARAISGDPRLRAAAEEAVAKWRYKPYSLNGRAAEVVTNVRVSFRLR
jgi:TonB family protein